MYICGNVPKPRDLVILEKNFGMNAQIGVMARVNKIYERDNDVFIDIIWADDKSNSQSDGGYFANTFKLVKRWVEEMAEKHKEEILDKWGAKGLSQFKKLYKIVEVSGKISLKNLAEELDLGNVECRERVWEWAYILGYTARDDHVFSSII